jgi:hypothetical protein
MVTHLKLVLCFSPGPFKYVICIITEFEFTSTSGMLQPVMFNMVIRRFIRFGTNMAKGITCLPVAITGPNTENYISLNITHFFHVTLRLHHRNLYFLTDTPYVCQS